MDERDDNPDTSYRRRLDEDDTEGHKVTARGIDDEDDVEGHKLTARSAVDDDDTEGHGLTKRS